MTPSTITNRFCLWLLQFINHPDYVNTAGGNDVALVELDRPANIGFYVSPICLPNGEEPDVGTRCYATGYGATGT